MADRTIDKVVRAARERGLTDTEAARQMGVEKQVFSNWKRRGMPPTVNQKAADFIGCTIDELVGRLTPPRKVAEPQMLYGYALTAEGAHIGAEWEKLDEPLRGQIRTMINTLVAEQIRESRKKLKLAKVRADESAKGTEARRSTARPATGDRN